MQGLNVQILVFPTLMPLFQPKRLGGGGSHWLKVQALTFILHARRLTFPESLTVCGVNIVILVKHVNWPYVCCVVQCETV